MPIYNMLCDNSINGCGLKFSTECLMKNLDTHLENLVCPNCKQNNTLHQVYSPPIVHILNTLGSLADKNTSTFSKDYRDEISAKNNAYKNKKNWQIVDGKIRHNKDIDAEERRGITKSKKAAKKVGSSKPLTKKKRPK